MKILFKLDDAPKNIQLGDIVIGANGRAHLVVAEDGGVTGSFPVKLICLTTCFIENSFASLQSLNKAQYIIASNPIVKIIPADEIRISRIGEVI